MSPADALASVDLSPPSDLLGQTGCKGLVACLNGCPPLDNGCSFGCGQASSKNGIMLYGTSIDCAQTYCVNAGECAWANAQMTMVKSKPGDVPAICNNCLTDSESALFGNSCVHPGSADCTQMQCTQQFAACLNDRP